jgi:hypothetical protein
MSSTNLNLTLLLEQLELTGPPAVAMLEGTRPLDPVVVLAALEARGLLGDRELDGDAGSVSRRLVSLVRANDVLATVVAQLDLGPETMDLAGAAEPDELETRFDALVALAGVHAMLPDHLASRTLGLLERNTTWAALHPEKVLSLVVAAEAHQAALDLPSSHIVYALLDSVLEAEVHVASPAPAVDWDAAIRQAERALFPPSWAIWAQRLGDTFSELRALLSQPTATLAPAWAASDPTGGDGDHASLALKDDEELAIRRVGRNLQLVWAGEGAGPIEATLEGRSLQSAPAPVPGTAAWWLDAPPGGEAEFVVHWPDRRWHVVVAADSA